jgi:uncharacterized membrane protein YeaQ/YmgE (transglycosylase-associated protein family)
MSVDDLGTTCLSADDREMIMEIFGVIVAGIIVGVLGKWVAPDARDKTPLWMTILCGIAGVIVGWYIAVALGVAATSGVDWVRWIISVIAAAIFVAVAATVTGRTKVSKHI